MAPLRYKAYLSYSHRDEASAIWLHRALESYRVPPNLVGTATESGSVPARIRPVFRDRDDLSSAADLAESVKQALAASDNLIVLCSPDAGASHWVNEEIHEFARLGRADRIFCIIVAGEATDSSDLSACFPPALANAGVLEPLAADARKWADGKHLAKLKLIAGLLGLPLDRLRQREMQRRRKRKLIIGLGVVAVIALTLVTVFSRISQQHEREKAEQLASFVVDLGQRLQSDSDLETLSLISTEAYKNLQSLDPEKLSPETGRQVALALRQMGQVNQYRDKPEDALEAFTKSRDMLLDLQKKHPEDSQTLHELSNAEFYIGNFYYTQGVMGQAFEHMQVYFDLTQRLVGTDPQNPNWIMELSYAHNNLAALQIDSGKGINDTTLAHVDKATELMEKVVALKPEDKEAVSGLATVLAWAADAQLLACNIDEASKLREQVRVLSEKLSRQNPANNILKQNMAFAMTGVARIQTLTGEYDLARQNLDTSISILQLLADADPSNVIAKQEVVGRQVMLAKLLVDLGQLDRAAPLLEEIESAFKSVNDLSSRNLGFQRDYIDYLIVSADVDAQMQRPETANFKLESAMQHQQALLEQGHRDLFDKYRQANARYLWWQINGVDNGDYPFVLQANARPTANDIQSCNDAEASMLVALVEQDQVLAEREAGYLLLKGYAAPDFARTCGRFQLCPESRQ